MNKFVAWYAARRKAFASLAGLALMYASQRWGASNQYVEIAIGAFAAIGVHEVNNDNPLNVIQQDVGHIVDPGSPPQPQPDSGGFFITPSTPSSGAAEKVPDAIIHFSGTVEESPVTTNTGTKTEVVNDWGIIPGGNTK